MFRAPTNQSSEANKRARQVASQETRESSALPRSFRKTDGGRAQDAAYRKEIKKSAKSARKGAGLGRHQCIDDAALELIADAHLGERTETGSTAQSTGSGAEDEEDEESQSEGDEESESEGKASPKKAGSSKEQDRRYAIPWRPADLETAQPPSSRPRTPSFVQSKLLQTLKGWSRDNNCDHQRVVRALYAAWHPDKHRFFPGSRETSEASECHHAVVEQIFQVQFCCCFPVFVLRDVVRSTKCNVMIFVEIRGLNFSGTAIRSSSAPRGAREAPGEVRRRCEAARPEKKGKACHGWRECLYSRPECRSRHWFPRRFPLRG